MLVGQKMVAEEIIRQQNISVLNVQYLCSPKASIDKDLFDFSTPSPSSSPSSVFCEVRASDSISIDISRSESVVSCSTSIQTTTLVESSTRKFVPSIRSGSHADIGSRELMEDEHIRIDDLCSHLGSPFWCNLPSAFYAVFDGHGGPEAAAFVKNNAIRIFFEDAGLPQTSDINDAFLEELGNSHRRAFLMADQALDDEFSVSACCGTTALTALVLGSHLLIANAGDCRAVLCKKGVAVPMSQDHRPSYLPERKRVEERGGFIMSGYLNNELAVTRALGDWYMKSFNGSASPLIAEPDIRHIMLTEEDEFLIIGCDGIWDVMSNQDAVSLVRRQLRRHDDPQQCARELVNQALRLHTNDNLTAIVVCFTPPDCRESAAPQRPRFSSLTEEARNKLRSLLGGN